MKIMKSPNPYELTIEGLIIYETKNTFIIRTERGDKVIPKAGRIFVLEVNDEKYTLLGDRLVGRPEERVKRV